MPGKGMGTRSRRASPTARIDYVFVGDAVQVVLARVATEASSASDHLPVVVDLRLRTGEPDG